jgi:hypothetical protein
MHQHPVPNHQHPVPAIRLRNVALPKGGGKPNRLPYMSQRHVSSGTTGIQ